MEARKQQPPEVNWTTRQTVAIYAAAGLVYVALGIFIPELLFSWWEGVPFLLLSIWAAHRIWRRLA